jgi:hypothetical protein
MTRPEIYVSTDIEADGPIPGVYSMLSFASAAYTETKDLVDTFSANLETLPDTSPHPKTQAWWDKHPAAYDFMFIYWYLIRYVGESPFSHFALDIKSYAMAVLKSPFRETSKRKMPKRWFDDLPHTHVALNDALEQGALFCNILAEN